MLILIVGLALVLVSCGPARRTRSAFETLLGALPLSDEGVPSAHLTYVDLRAWRAAALPPPLANLPVDASRVDQLLTDGAWAAVGGDVGPSDVGEGVSRGPYRVNAVRGLVARPGFLLSGPPARISESLSWLGDQGRSAAAETGLLDLARTLGEPALASVSASHPPCPARWVASAERLATARAPRLSAWVLVYEAGDGEASARAASADLPRVRAAVAARPPPGRLLEVGLRPHAVVVTFEGSGGDPSALCS
jgi:hypothetical protein